MVWSQNQKIQTEDDSCKRKSKNLWDGGEEDGTRLKDKEAADEVGRTEVEEVEDEEEEDAEDEEDEGTGKIARETEDEGGGADEDEHENDVS